MKTGTRLLILCLLAPAALAENMSLRSGRVLKDAVVVSSGDDFVNIQYTDGVAKVSYKDLTDAQQRDYRMTPDEVKARLDQRRMEEAAAHLPWQWLMKCGCWRIPFTRFSLQKALPVYCGRTAPRQKKRQG